MKVVHHLGLLGLIETVRGRSGGLRLGMEPDRINLGEVVRKTEPDFAMVECFNKEHNDCILAPACELQGVLRQAVVAYMQVLDGVTLADLLRNDARLRKIAKIDFHQALKTA
jgi:Rrf2 family nitric oxide-sensitive transcriptional repressor